MILHRESWGDPGSPPVVCVHGIQSRAFRFAELADTHLSAGRRAVSVDLRGHGASAWDPPWNLETHVDDLLETASAEGIGKAAWIGHSFGGRLVYELAARAPDRVERLVLLDPALDLQPAKCRDWAEQNRMEDESWETFEGIVNAWAFEYPRAPRERVERTARLMATRREDGRWQRAYLRSAVIAALGEMARPLPEPASVPTLLLVAERGELVTAAHTARLAGRLGDLLTTAVVPGGHGVLTEAFDETAEAILSFLDSEDAGTERAGG